MSFERIPTASSQIKHEEVVVRSSRPQKALADWFVACGFSTFRSTRTTSTLYSVTEPPLLTARCSSLQECVAALPLLPPTPGNRHCLPLSLNRLSVPIPSPHTQPPPRCRSLCRAKSRTCFASSSNSTKLSSTRRVGAPLHGKSGLANTSQQSRLPTRSSRSHQIMPTPKLSRPSH